jgi:hypothetical protein
MGLDRRTASLIAGGLLLLAWILYIVANAVPIWLVIFTFLFSRQAFPANILRQDISSLVKLHELDTVLTS